MSKITFLVFTLMTGVQCFAQTSFENGYFINNSGNKIECLIKNYDWNNNPTEIEYMLTDNGDIQKAVIANIKEFSVINKSKYVKASVDIDKTSNKIKDLNENREPEFSNETVLLKILVEGDANLYFYREGQLSRYFFSTKNSEIKQLIYKQYLTTNSKLGSNNYYLQQLFNEVNCKNKKSSDLENLEYGKHDLINYFVDYNKCINPDFQVAELEPERDKFNLTLRPGLKSSALSIENSSRNDRDTEFKNELSLRLGVEAEFILPFNNNKWAITLEPTYQSYKSKYFDPNEGFNTELTSTVDYKSVEIPLGLRHYLFLINNSKLFVNVLYQFSIDFGSSVDFERSEGRNKTSLDIKSNPNLALGLGYKFKDRYSIELRHDVKRNLLGVYPNWDSNFRGTSLIFGYSIFNK
ncbi:outer membrane beta-barrel protein [Leeuwenhoekiella sp. NPDC079379]|uniref:outer membrane beta-barrel protein n=1 Tax=Leeuwenhoekiella sp. NPDC079379 TaxID=3364122 RepID=UPI0037CAA61A